MLDARSPVIPPAPPTHQEDLPPLRLLLGSIRNSLAIWPKYAFDTPFNRYKLFGLSTVLVNSPEGVRHVMSANAANYRRPAMMARIMRPIVGRGLFLAEGEEWKQQRRRLSAPFSPRNVNVLLPHFAAAADDLVHTLEGRADADLDEAFQHAALNAVLRALFSIPDAQDRRRIADLVLQYVSGPGRPQLFDGFATSENSYAFSLGRRRAFQRKWAEMVGDIVARRGRRPNRSRADLLDLLLAAQDPQTGEPLGAEEVRDQCATMIFAGFETTARLMFWASYLLTLDQSEQSRIRAEISAFPPERIETLDDLENWPRLRLTLLEALRLYPPVPLLVREPIAEDQICGESVRPREQIYVAPWVLHRHRRHWDRPTAFMPERFEGQAAPWTAGGAYIPFGSGPRICIGAVFALAEAQIMLATLLRRWTLSIPDGRAVLPVGRLTIQPNKPPRFRLGH